MGTSISSSMRYPHAFGFFLEVLEFSNMHFLLTEAECHELEIHRQRISVLVNMSSADLAIKNDFGLALLSV